MKTRSHRRSESPSSKLDHLLWSAVRAPIERLLVELQSRGVGEREAAGEFGAWIRLVSANWPARSDKQPRRKPRAIDAGELGPTESLLAYALLCRAILLAAAGRTELDDLEWRFPDHRPVLDWLDRLAEEVDAAELDRRTADVLPALLGADERTDWLHPIYERLIPARVRSNLGEYYTPGWLADHLVGRVWTAGARWLDPSVGSGAFLVALARESARRGEEVADAVGIDRNPWAVLAAAANCVLLEVAKTGRLDASYRIPLACLDPATTPAPAGLSESIDRVIGNPPWVLWDRLDEEYRDRTREAWRRYGLFSETGMDAILGGGKKDLAMLLTYVAADRYLRVGGRLGFVITQSVFSAAGSARGFRRWRLPDGAPLAVLSVEDLTAMQPFRGATTKTSLLFLEKGKPTVYPVPYHVASRNGVEGMVRQLAQPATATDPLSAWRHCEPQCAALVESVMGRCDYHAHLGVNTGGANGVYWLQRLQVRPDGLWRMRNMTERSKQTLPAVEIDLEPTFLYPLLIGKDVRRWRAEPSAWILLVQDPQKRRGVDAETLRVTAPRTFDYLAGFEAVLRRRAAFRRYFSRPRSTATTPQAPFYSMFDVGTYSLAPVKVVWNRMGSKLAAAVVGAAEGKPIQPQETHCLFALEDEAEAFYLAALLNSRWARAALESFGQVGGKSFATPRSIQQLELRRYRPDDPLHIELSRLGRRAGTESTAAAPHPSTVDRIDHAAADYWTIPADPSATTAADA